MTSINLSTNNNNNNQAPLDSICSNDFRLLRKIYKACGSGEVESIDKKMSKLSLECRNQIDERMPNITNKSQDLQSAIRDFSCQYFKIKKPNSKMNEIEAIVKKLNKMKATEIEKIECRVRSLNTRIVCDEVKVNKMKIEIDILEDKIHASKEANEIETFKREREVIERDLEIYLRFLNKYKREFPSIQLLASAVRNIQNEMWNSSNKSIFITDPTLQYFKEEKPLIFLEKLEKKMKKTEKLTKECECWNSKIIKKQIDVDVLNDKISTSKEVNEIEAFIIKRTKKERKLKTYLTLVDKNNMMVKIKELLESAEYEVEKNEIEAKKKQIKYLLNVVINTLGEDKAAAIKNHDGACLELSRLKDLLLARHGCFEIEQKRIHVCKDKIDVLKKRTNALLSTRPRIGAVEEKKLELTKAKINELEAEISRMRERIKAIKSGYYIKPAVKAGNNNNNQ